jgi:Rad3-related DNA helicase
MFCLWCFNPALVFAPLAKEARCVVVTSGTLSTRRDVLPVVLQPRTGVRTAGQRGALRGGHLRYALHPP